jgi:hypothetical protein
MAFVAFRAAGFAMMLLLLLVILKNSADFSLSLFLLLLFNG